MVDSSSLPTRPRFSDSPSSTSGEYPAAPRPVVEVADSMCGAAQQVVAALKDLATETLGLRAAREAADAERAVLQKSTAALIRIASTLGGVRADLLEGLRVEVALECEGRLAAQTRSHNEVVSQLTAELQTTLEQLAEAQALLAAEPDSFEAAGFGSELVPVVPEPPKPKRPVAPRRRRTSRLR